MLLRGANAVGYATYPDNVITDLCAKQRTGHRYFPDLRFAELIENMRVAIDAALETGGVCEAAICYTGDILDPARDEIFAEILRRMAQAAGEAGSAFPGYQGHGGLASRTRRANW